MVQIGLIFPGRPDDNQVALTSEIHQRLDPGIIVIVSSVSRESDGAHIVDQETQNYRDDQDDSGPLLGFFEVGSGADQENQEKHPQTQYWRNPEFGIDRRVKERESSISQKPYGQKVNEPFLFE
jgi:hypothetical protein